ncbi:MAG: peptidylprolyl isomerase [Rhodovulum sp.]|nr:peptidylprolyl isomerase [Paracoccaceae bacterium]MCC0066642.1 peptidylprolyl isomerase [Rhodovulum sp.]
MRGMIILLAFLCTATAVGPARAANPYAAAYTVNNGVITFYDIEQRTMFLEALGAPGDVRELAIKQLTEDRLKIQAAESLGIELPEGAIEAGKEEFATGRGLTVEDVDRVLESRGIDQQTMDDFVEAGISWREVVGTLFRARASPTEEDIDAALEFSATAPVEVVQLAEIAIPFAERGEPETLALADRIHADLTRGANFAEMARRYSRSSSAERDGLIEPLPAAQLPAAMRSQILLMRPGQVTPPMPISGGVAILKLVSVRQEAPPPSEQTEEERREALRAKLFNDRITAFGQGYLQELVSDALITER